MKTRTEIVDGSIARLTTRPETQKVSPSPLVHGKRILVTGAGGFIASALCKQLASYGPEVLILVESSEYALYEIQRQLSALLPDSKIVPVLGDYGDTDCMQLVLSHLKPTLVYHVAAYKHVPLVELNPLSAIKNNVMGARSFFRQCETARVEELVVVSSDKAVNPTNIMGATKRLVEYLGLTSRIPRVKVVRFGNVMWSSGSVLPLFYEQINAGQQVTVTHKDVDRFFMSVGQSVQLILQSQFLPNGVYCFSMGKPVRIVDLVEQIAEDMGKTADIKYIGLRPGEKLHEELTLGEGLTPTSHPDIEQAHEGVPDDTEMAWFLNSVAHLMKAGDMAGIRRLLTTMVPGYAPTEEALEVARNDNCFWQPKEIV